MDASTENLKIIIVSTDLKDVPILDKINQYVKIRYTENSFSTDTSYDSGPDARFDTKQVFDLGEATKEQNVLLEVWSKESEHRGSIKDWKLGSCFVTMDQLKIGSGIQESFNLIRNNSNIGTIMVRSIYQPPPFSMVPPSQPQTINLGSQPAIQMPYYGIQAQHQQSQQMPFQPSQMHTVNSMQHSMSYGQLQTQPMAIGMQQQAMMGMQQQAMMGMQQQPIMAMQQPMMYMQQQPMMPMQPQMMQMQQQQPMMFAPAQQQPMMMQVVQPQQQMMIMKQSPGQMKYY